MNVNVKISISDEDRNIMFRRLTGKDTKGMVSRADVNEWVKEKLESFLRLGSPTTENASLLETAMETDERQAIRDAIDEGDLEAALEEATKQNELLLTRVNQLQHKLDTIKRK